MTESMEVHIVTSCYHTIYIKSIGSTIVSSFESLTELCLSFLPLVALSYSLLPTTDVNNLLSGISASVVYTLGLP